MDLLEFGPISLQAGRGVISTMSVTGSVVSASSEVLGRKAATQYKGPGLVKVDLTVRLHRQLLGRDVLGVYRSWVRIQEAGEAHPLQVGGSFFADNPMLLTECRLSSPQYGYDGNLLCADVSLSFQEYLPPAAVAVSSGGMASGGSAPGVASAEMTTPAGLDPYGVQGYAPEEKNSLKRSICGPIAAMVQKVADLAKGGKK